MATVNLRSFRQLVRHNKRRIKRFLTKLETKRPKDLVPLTLEADKYAWSRTDCLECANCSVTLTYHRRDRRMLCHYCDYAQKVPSVGSVTAGLQVMSSVSSRGL